MWQMLKIFLYPIDKKSVHLTGRALFFRPYVGIANEAEQAVIGGAGFFALRRCGKNNLFPRRFQFSSERGPEVPVDFKGNISGTRYPLPRRYNRSGFPRLAVEGWKQQEEFKNDYARVLLLWSVSPSWRNRQGPLPCSYLLRLSRRLCGQKTDSQIVLFCYNPWNIK